MHINNLEDLHNFDCAVRIEAVHILDLYSVTGRVPDSFVELINDFQEVFKEYPSIATIGDFDFDDDAEQVAEFISDLNLKGVIIAYSSPIQTVTSWTSDNKPSGIKAGFGCYFTGFAYGESLDEAIENMKSKIIKENEKRIDNQRQQTLKGITS